MKQWKKLGQLFEIQAINEDILTHASNPLAIHLEKDIFRIFFSGRNQENRSSVGYIDIDILTQEIKYVANSTTFRYGLDDSFYSHGVSIGNMYSIGQDDYILFMGWQVRDGGHWRGDIGRLLVENKEVMTLEPSKAFMVSDEEDPISLSYPWVMKDEGIYKMWYGSTLDWNSVNNEMVHVIKFATSQDGHTWEKHGLAIPYELGIAQAFSRPTVLKDNIGYHMWFSYRSGNGTPYRIGYAHSHDGINWNRKEKSGIDVSKSGWDSEMICYPFVFEHEEKTYMLYNGNQFGKGGFGLAIMEDKL